MVNTGVGYTVMIASSGAPGQAPLEGVTVRVAVVMAPLETWPLNVGGLPVPLAPRPILVLLFVQVYVVPPEPEKAMEIGFPAQLDTSATGFMEG